MDLKRELLQVLDNPARVWDAIVTNLSNEPRVSLLTFTTCETPLDVVDWQASIARVNLEAAATFEASLRALDDSFVHVSRQGPGIHYATFRNPSMDDFCVSHLDANAGFATRVAAREPSLKQVARLIKLATARDPNDPTRPRHANLRSALIAEPDILLERLLELLSETTQPTLQFIRPAQLIMRILSAGNLSQLPREAEVRARLVPTILTMTFRAHAGYLYEWLDDRRYAQTLAALLGDRFDEFYESIAASANELAHYDSLVDLDRALGRSPEQASWADAFSRVSWFSESENADSLRSDRDFFEKIADYLDLDAYNDLNEWNAAVEELEAKERRAAQDDDESWRELPSDEQDESTSSDVSERAIVDALFESLTRP